jgi:hypothetical protein
MASATQPRKRDRPKGSKDRQPRKRRQPRPVAGNSDAMVIGNQEGI